METPIPQPYDITDIPHIAWVPGPATWCGVILTLAALTFIVWRRKNPHNERAAKRLLDSLVKELQSAAASEHVSVERISRAARRVGSHLTDINLAELTSDELRTYPTEALTPSLREILLSVAAVEDVGYAPPSSERDAKARILIADLIERIIAYRSTRRSA
jgi:uncharacterized membrane protein YccC